MTEQYPKHLSYSSISTLLKCPRAWKYRYILKRPSVSSGNLIIGRVYHQALAAAYLRKIQGVEPMSDEELADTFSHFWENEIAGKYTFDEDGEPKLEEKYIEWGSEDPGKLKDKGIKMSQLYCEKVMPLYKPIKIEEKASTNVDGINVIGYMDAIAERISDSTKVIIDHKWRKKRYSEQELESDFQSTTYDLLTGIHDIEFHAGLNLAKPGIKIYPVHRTDEDVEWVKQLIKEAAGMIKGGSFPPNPTSWSCSIEYCPNYTECRMGGL